LPTAGGDDCIRARFGGIAEEEFELPQLVAAAAERHEIIALGVDSNAVQ
jgi:hypothetical protein